MNRAAARSRLSRKEQGVLPAHRSSLRLYLITLLLLCGWVSLPADAQTTAPPVINAANGHWYQAVRVPGGINWADARAAAEALIYAGYRGHLATITSAEEQQFFVSQVPLAPENNGWLGGYQDLAAPDYREPAGGWRWVTGEPWRFTNWDANQPDNALGAEHALHGGVRWNDLPPTARLNIFVVEYEPPATPTAAHVGILPNPVVGGESTIGLITLDRPAAPGDVMVTLSTSDAGVAAPPQVVIVTAGTSSALFSLLTFPVARPTTVTLTVGAPGGSRMVAVHVLPPGAAIPLGNLLANGSFEQPPVAAGTSSRVLSGVDALPGWKITGGDVDVLRAPAWQTAPGEGAQALDLVGLQPGRIEQAFATEPGREYLFSGWIAHTARAPLAPQGRADVFLNGQFFLQLFHRDAEATDAAMRWTPFSYRFRATSATTTLALADATNSGASGGIALDGLSVTPLEPNLLANGSFEEPPVPDDKGWLTLSGGGLPGWQILQGAAEPVHQRYWRPAPGQGRQSLHLTGSPGTPTIQQSVATEPGRLYRLSGWLTHNWSIPEGRAHLFVNGELLAPLYHSRALYGATSAEEMRWQPFTYDVRATTPTTLVQIADVTHAGGGGVVLDGLVLAPAEAPAPGQPPAAPSGLSVRVISAAEIQLAWTDNSSDETGFEVQRQGGGSDWARLAIVGAGIARFSDFGVRPSTAYIYRVRAMSDRSVSDWSNEASVTTLAP
jgi:hypothetical protein